MEWDWQSFTPSSTPTSTVFDFNVNNNSVNNVNTSSHFHDAFSSSPYLDPNPNLHHHQQQQQQQQQHSSYQSYAPPNTSFPTNEPFQMQTPPPTRGSSIKQRPQHLDTAAFNFAAPVSWSQPSATAPAPLSAPVWTALADDPFSHWSSQPATANPAPVRPSINRSTSSNSISYPTPSTVKKVAVNSSLDPSLLCSSPVRPLPSTSTAREKPSLAPAFSMSSRPPSPVKNAGLQRSNTVGALLKPSPNIVPNNPVPSTFPVRSNSIANPPRRSSPLKRTARGSLSSIAESSRPPVRTSVVLTIDANGTARTETRIIEESPTRSIKEKYPNLWDDSDSDSDSTSSKQWPSRNSSLSYTKSNEERQPKMAKLNSSTESLDLVQLSRSNSSASLKTPSKASYTTAAQLRRQGSIKKQQRTPNLHSRRNTLSSLNSSFENLAAMDLNKDDKLAQQNDASSALRQAVGNRVSPPVQPIHPDQPSKSTRPRQLSQPQKPQSLRQTQHLQQQQYQHQNQHQHQDQHQNQHQQQHQPQQQQHQQPLQQQQPQHQQPLQHQQQQNQPQIPHPPPSEQNYTHTKSQSVSYPLATTTAPVFDPRGSFTMDMTPMAYNAAPVPAPIAFTNDMSSMTRCICQIPFDDGRMLQCNMCAMWSHSGCIGLDPSSQHAYVCAFCVSPVQYGHPVRSSSMQNFNAWPVPGL